MRLIKAPGRQTGRSGLITRLTLTKTNQKSAALVLVDDDPALLHALSFAFETEGYDGMAAKLTERGLAFETKELPDFRLRQIFVHDPNGVKLELNFRKA